MTEKVRMFISELRRAQDRGESTICPACGRKENRPVCESHICEALICKNCYRLEEGIMEMNAPMDLRAWNVFGARAGENPYRARKAAEIIDDIERGGTVKALVSIIKEWYADTDAEGNEVLYRYRAFSECLGLCEIRFSKDGITRADFEAEDSQVVVSLKNKGGRVMYAINIRGVF